MTEGLKTNDVDGRKVLVVGRLDGVFVESIDDASTSFQECENILEAVELAAKNTYNIIAVCLSGLQDDVDFAFQSLRRVNRQAKIVALVQMHEEPAAIKLMQEKHSTGYSIDDYYVCPVSYECLGQINEKNGRDPAQQSQDSDKEEQIKILEAMAVEDELTGVKNRRYAREFLRQIIVRAQNKNLQVTLFVFDIDDFKSYNDSFGHATGDRILTQAAILMRNCCRKQDVVARIGGDEFAVIFWNTQDEVSNFDTTGKDERRAAKHDHPTETVVITKRFTTLLKNTDLPALGPNADGHLTISGGLATFPRDGVTASQLFEKADQALLEAKRNGKNLVYLIGKAESSNEDKFTSTH